MRRPISIVAAHLAILVVGCQGGEIVLPASLESPRSVALLGRGVCLDAVSIGEGLSSPRVRPCAATEDSDLMLIANATIDRVAVARLGATPQLIDLDVSIPGVTHIPVGAYPLSVAASPDGHVAYTANQEGQSVSVVNLWAMAEAAPPWPVEGRPRSVAVRWDNGEVVVGAALPSAIHVGPGAQCEAPERAPIDPKELDPASGCTVPEASWRSAPLPGSLEAIALDPRREGLAYIVYADRAFLSVVALDDGALGPGEACLVGGRAPCEIERIGLTYGCSDGIDNDDDGLADADDPQCFDALGAESEAGIGRRAQGACADGADGDGDGLIDRDDPDCQVATDAEERAPDRAQAACSNGADDDADGLVDALDPDCYGPLDDSEFGLAAGGYAAVDVDELGIFAYIADPAERQALVVDLERRRLIDAPRARSEIDAFADPLGIVVGATARPSAIVGRIARSVEPLSSSAHALIRYDLGAHVAADNAFVYFVDVATVYCEVFETREGGTLSSREFYSDRDALAASNEASCLALDPLLADLAIDAAQPEQERACSIWRSCERCLAQDLAEPAPTLSNCAGCAGIDEERAAELGELCGAPAIVDDFGLVRRVANARLSVRDADAQQAGTFGRASCTEPEELVARLIDYQEANPGTSSDLGCGSPLLPQPLSPLVTIPRSLNARGFLDTPRAAARARIEAGLIPSEEGDRAELASTTVTLDAVARDEQWTVAYEGILPGARTQRARLVADQPGVLLLPGADLCRAGARANDLLILRPEEVAAGCEDLIRADQPDFLTFRVTEAGPNRIAFEPIALADRPDGAIFADEPPAPACIEGDLTAEVRAPEVFVVSGSRSGAASGLRRQGSRCVPDDGALGARAQARIEPGEHYRGPSFDFYMYPGLVEPVRGFEYTIPVRRRFASGSSPEGPVVNFAPRPNVRGPFGTRMTDLAIARVYEELDDGAVRERRALVATSPNDDVVFVVQLVGRAFTAGLQ